MARDNSIPEFEPLPVEDATHLLLVLGFRELVPAKEQINPPVEAKRDATRPAAAKETGV